MPEISILFQGICTHLTAMHSVKGVAPFEIVSGDTTAQHRVFLANPALIATEIDPTRHVAEHVPKLKIPADQITEELQDILQIDPEGRYYERVLSNDAIVFELDQTKDKKLHWDPLSPLPSIWKKSEEKGFRPKLRLSALRGWTPYASAYIDFLGGTGALSFSVDAQSNVLAMLRFRQAPTLLLRHRNEGKGVTYNLPADCQLVISNLPERAGCCNSDYLLHYFATTLDMRYKAPEWTPLVTHEQKIDAIRSGNPVSEVYCSSSTYP